MKNGYTVQSHLGGIENYVVRAYDKIVDKVQQIDPNVKEHPTALYIALKHEKNFAYSYLNKHSLRLRVNGDYRKVFSKVKRHQVKELPASTATSFNGPCVDIYIRNSTHLDEVVDVVMDSYKMNK
jgi:predicted transport protein